MSNSLYNNDDLENYLEKQVKQHRMYPSDHIWRNIQSTLHGERSWPALTIISIIVIAALTAGTILVKPSTASLIASYHPALPVEKIIEDKQSASASAAMEKHLSADNITQQTIASVSKKLGIETPDINAAPANALHLQMGDITGMLASSGIENMNTETKTSTPPSADKMLKENNEIIAAAKTSVDESSVYQNNNSFNDIYSFAKPEMKINSADISEKNIIIPENSNASDIWRNYPVTNKPAANPKPSRFTFQVYVTPSADYRRFTQTNISPSAENSVSSRDVSNYNSDINKTMRSTRALGMEAGFAFGYRLNKQITLKTGLQFNMRQYDIDAYSYKNEYLTFVSNSNANTDTSTNSSQPRGYPAGVYPVTLANRYYELSLPVGLNWQLVTQGKLSLSVAASIQPTYTFGSNPFIISSDYKNYFDGSSLLHKWNINTSLETYLSYTLGDYTWQIGPQFRYQQLPSFKSAYPVKEYLMDYGIKIGFTKSIK